jgi:hypothetical protein
MNGVPTAPDMPMTTISHPKVTAVRRTYDFPNARIVVYHEGTCREFPKWCLSISCKRTRGYVAGALAELRRRRREPSAHTSEVDRLNQSIVISAPPC